MAGPVFIPGGETKLVLGDSAEDRKEARTESRGVFAAFPGATKKYIVNDGPRDNEYRETMARMFIQMTEQERKLFVDTVKDPVTQKLAEVLVGTGNAGEGGTGFIDFLLQRVNERFTEKYQVVEGLSDNFVVYLFGQGAPTFSYSGMLLNTYQDDQRVWMTKLYQDVLRGTQLARRRKLLRLRYDSVIVSGVMLDLNMALEADKEDRVPFTFNFIPTQYVVYTPSLGNPTRLKSAFLPSSSLALTTAQTPQTTRLRVSSRAAPPAQATRKRQNQQTTDNFKFAKPDTTQSPSAQPLVDRTRQTSTEVKQQQSIANTYGGAPHLTPLPQSVPQ